LWTASRPRGLTGRSKGENAFSKPDPVNLNPKSCTRPAAHRRCASFLPRTSARAMMI